MRHAAVVSLMCATLCACEPAPEARPVTQDSAVAMPVAQARFHAARLITDLQDPAIADRIEETKARSVGIVYPAITGNLPGELAVVNDTSHEVQTVARLRWYLAPEGGWSDTLWVRDARLYGASLERATHDDYGMAAMARRGEWAQVVFAFDSVGTAQRGWVRIVPERVLYADYDSLLLNLSTQFNDPAAVTFFDKPAGQRINMALPASHSVSVIGFQGEWIQVALASPDTSACTGDPEARIQRRDTVWVPRLNTNKRRQIFAATAGC